MLKEFKLSRGLLSSYYIAAIFSFFLFQLPMVKEVIKGTATWLISALKVAAGIEISNTSAWLTLFLVCFCITFAMRRFVVYPLGFYINDEGAPTWELIALALLVLGFYIYLLNQVFIDQPMPASWPRFLLRLLDGYKNTFSVATPATIEERNTWAVVPWFWLVGPLTFMYVRTKLMKDKDE